MTGALGACDGTTIFANVDLELVAAHKHAFVQKLSRAVDEDAVLFHFAEPEPASLRTAAVWLAIQRR